MSKNAPLGIIDADLRPYAEPLGTLIIANARAEANLIDVVSVMQSEGSVAAFKLLNKNKPERVLADINSLIDSGPLDEDEKKDLKFNLSSFWSARKERHRLVHDDWFPDWDERRGLVVALFGRVRNSSNTISYNEPEIDEIYALAELVSQCGQSFADYTHIIAEKRRDLLLGLP